MPAPMTTQRKSRDGAISCRLQLGARGSVPANASSSTRKSLHCGVEDGPTRKSKTRVTSSGLSSCGGAPDASCSSSAWPARARASASCSGPRPRPGTSIWAWSGARSARNRLKFPVRWATAHSSGCTSTASNSCCNSSPVGVGPPLRPATLLCSSVGPTVGAHRHSSNRDAYSCIALTSAVIWLLTSTVRGSESMAEAKDSGVHRSSVDTSSAMDQPP